MDTQRHGTDDQIDRYTLGTLPEAEVAAFEEHLLICDACREQTEIAQAFNIAIREALKQEAPAARSAASRKDWRAWLRRPAFQMALALVLILAAVSVYVGRGSRLPPLATLQLTATRGEMPSVHPARELELSLAGAPADCGPFRVEVVNSGGGKVWDGLADTEGDAVIVRVATALQPGDYFARLISDSGALAREYGFRIEK